MFTNKQINCATIYIKNQRTSSGYIFFPPADWILDSELDRSHQLIRLDLLVGHLAFLVDPAMADLLLLLRSFWDSFVVLTRTAWKTTTTKRIKKKIEKSNQDNILWLISIILAKTICDSKKFLFKDWKNGNQDNNFWLISIFFYCWLNVTICDSKKYLFKDWNMVI